MEMAEMENIGEEFKRRKWKFTGQVMKKKL